ncbi:GGDEF domain-containing protein [Paenibacillus azoreducens]|uniref:GGDEF domain-containing protein n=1 Tax=Paenibacillus azoreducens TaxID=116718 RepID=A0A920CRV7_9BACL|nr:hypothetical protein [Paenibacillus azoreducens]GIO51476.1 hypothetical protein J34TS1_62410 [Paenibacillus azoreducens]
MERFQALQDGLIIGISLILLLMCALMYLRWKTQLYLNFSGAALLGVFATIGLASFSDKPGVVYMFFASLFTCGLIMQQINSFRLFYHKRTDRLYVHLGTAFLTVLAAAASLFLPTEMSSLLILLIVALLGCYSALKLFSENERLRNTLAIALYSVYALCLFVWAMTKVERLLLFGNLFLIFSLLVMFGLLFERIVGIMQAATFTSTHDEITGLLTRKHFMQQAHQWINRKQAFGIIYIDIAVNSDGTGLLNDVLLKNLGIAIMKYTEGFGISGRYAPNGFAVLVTKPDVEIGDLSDRIRMRLEFEAPGSIFTGHMLLIEDNELEHVIHEAAQLAERSRKHGLDKIHGLEQSRILSDSGVQK